MRRDVVDSYRIVSGVSGDLAQERNSRVFGENQSNLGLGLGLGLGQRRSVGPVQSRTQDVVSRGGVAVYSQVTQSQRLSDPCRVRTSETKGIAQNVVASIEFGARCKRPRICVGVSCREQT